jgi:hypothetical protein
MTMHLARGLSTLNTKVRKKKPLTKSQIEKLTVAHRKHNKFLKSIRSETLSFDDYVLYTRGQYKPKTQKKPQEYKPSAVFSRPNSSTNNIPSLDSGTYNAFKKETPKYTGNLIVGIATMHKSNAVPVMRGTNQAKEISSMRR